MIGFAARRENPRHHVGQKHGADAFGVGALGGTEIRSSQCGKRGTPSQESASRHWRTGVECVLFDDGCDGLVGCVLAELCQAQALQHFLHETDIDVGERPRREGGGVLVRGERPSQHRGVQHLVVGK